MARNSTVNIAVSLIAAVAVSVAAYQADAVLAPLTLGLFIIALVWPLQHRLQKRAPGLVALAITLAVTIVVILAFASLAVWAFTRVGHSLVADSARYQAIYDAAVAWLDSHGVSIAGVWAENVSVSRMLGWAHQITARVNTTLSFWLIALLYVVLGLMEVDDLRRRLEAIAEPGAAEALLETLFPTLLEMAQANTWETVLGIFVCLNIIQFVIGSYVEPRVSGAVLAISPLVVLFAVFFWTFLWGLYGAFIGVPIAIAALTFCGHYPRTVWIAKLFGGRLPEAAKPASW
jgi:AI-2 transport protein TqsA